jgi:hypothetical protein
MLQILEKKPHLSFIFSTQEECGGKIRSIMESENLESLPYGLIFDRKGTGDIIGTENGYCDEDLENVIHQTAKQYGYESTYGIYSDCDALSEVLPCVNLSCGYFAPHTDKEYTEWKSLLNALRCALDVLSNTPIVRYTLPLKKRSWGISERFSGYWDFEDTWDSSPTANWGEEFYVYQDEDNALFLCFADDTETDPPIFLLHEIPQSKTVTEIYLESEGLTVLVDTLSGYPKFYIEDEYTDQIEELVFYENDYQ